MICEREREREGELKSNVSVRGYGILGVWMIFLCELESIQVNFQSCV